MNMTAYELACDLINGSKNVQPCKYAPRGPQADAVQRFMGRPAGHETFITKGQSDLMMKLLGSANVINYSQGQDRFAGFVKTVWSEAKQQNYYLLTFCGYVMQKEEPAEETPANTDRANSFAATLIQQAIAKGFAKKDERAGAGEDYLCTWITKSQAESLLGMLPANALNNAGHVITQAVGSYCYWTKAKSASGAMLLCWMGEVKETKSAVVVPAVPRTLPGKLIPLDAEIPF
jgi:hypothetical protein